MKNSLMRAARYRPLGAADAVSVVTAGVPRPGRGEVLVRVHGSSVNHIDLMLRSGGFGLLRGWAIRGGDLDFAGEIEAAGEGVTDLTQGERVWGYLGGLPGATGTAADYVVVKRSRLSSAPRSIDLVAAAALPVAALTALQALRDSLGLRNGERILVLGASGGVGSSAVQLAADTGGRVTAVCRAAAADFCRSLGAADILAYDDPASSAVPGRYDAILDCAGARLGEYRRMAAPGGRIATVTPAGFARIPRWLVTPGPHMRPVITVSRSEDLGTLAGLVDEGRLRAVVEREYPLEAIATAHRDAETGDAPGKKVIRVLKDSRSTHEPASGYHALQRAAI